MHEPSGALACHAHQVPRCCTDALPAPPSTLSSPSPVQRCSLLLDVPGPHLQEARTPGLTPSFKDIIGGPINTGHKCPCSYPLFSFSRGAGPPRPPARAGGRGTRFLLHLLILFESIPFGEDVWAHILEIPRARDMSIFVKTYILAEIVRDYDHGRKERYTLYRMVFSNYQKDARWFALSAYYDTMMVCYYDIVIL